MHKARHPTPNPITNTQIADALHQLAELLEVRGDQHFRVRAFRRAASMVARHDKSFTDLVARGEDLVPLPMIGQDIAAKIEEYVSTGRMSQLADMEARMDPVRLQLLKVPGVGPQRLAEIDALMDGVITPQRLRAAASQRQLSQLRGIGPGVESAIADAFAPET